MIDRLIAEAERWSGYLEKKSNAQLDSFTGNAGKNNYTRFNRDYVAAMRSGSINMQWCGAYVSCMFMYAFGLEVAKKLLCGNLHCYTPSGASYFKKKGRYIKRGKGKPKRGDVVFFYSKAKGRIGHVGIVRKVSGSKVYTIEGNTSGASSLVTNGGGVRMKSYSMSSTYIDGYGRPPYSDVSEDDIKQYELGDRTLSKGMSGPDVKELQEKLLALNHDLGRYGADGDFGEDTEGAVKAFQKDAKLEIDGIAGPKTFAALAAVEPIEKGGSPDPEPGPEPVVPEDKPVVKGNVLIDGGQAHIRTGPGTQYPSAGVAKPGELYVGAETEGWIPVDVNGNLRWISATYAKVTGV